MLRELIYRQVYKISVIVKTLTYRVIPMLQTSVVDNFHKLFYDSGVSGGGWKQAKYFGVEIQKCPLDLFIYQEIIYATRPDLIIETGTAFGGTTLYMAHVLDQIKRGKIITVDIVKPRNIIKHDRITYLTGSSVEKKILEIINNEVSKSKRVMVILDSAHTKMHVSKELEYYSKFVSKNSYLIVEDTNINGHPVNIQHGPGPMEALEEFLLKNKNFKIDKSKHKFFLTFNPNGYLLKS